MHEVGIGPGGPGGGSGGSNMKKSKKNQNQFFQLKKCLNALLNIFLVNHFLTASKTTEICCDEHALDAACCLRTKSSQQHISVVFGAIKKWSTEEMLFGLLQTFFLLKTF